MLDALRRSLPAASRLSQRLFGALFAASMIGGFAGAHFRAPPTLLLAVFGVGAFTIGRLWGRIGWRAFNRLLVACILLQFLAATILLLVHNRFVSAVSIVVLPVGAAAAAALAAVGLQAQQPDAIARRKAFMSVMCLVIGLLAAAQWHEQAWHRLDSLIIVTAVVAITTYRKAS